MTNQLAAARNAFARALTDYIIVCIRSPFEDAGARRSASDVFEQARAGLVVAERRDAVAPLVAALRKFLDAHGTEDPDKYAEAVRDTAIALAEVQR